MSNQKYENLNKTMNRTRQGAENKTNKTNLRKKQWKQKKMESMVLSC